MKKYISVILVLVVIWVMAMAQVTTTPNLQLQLPPHGAINYDVILNNNFSLIDTAIGTLQSAYQGTWSGSSTYFKGQEVNYLGTIYVSLINTNFNNTPSSTPSAWAALFTTSGTVTTVGDLTNLFTVSNRTTAPSFSLVNQSANVVFAGPVTGSAAPPIWRALVAADLPTLLTSNISGNAATASGFLGTPTTCSAGNYARGVDIFGNATGCTAATGGVSPTSFSAVSHQFLTSYNSGTTLFTGAQPGFTDISGTATTAQLPASVVYNNLANTFGAGLKQTFGANATNAGMNLSGVTADPSTLANGDEWFRTDTGRYMYRVGGVSQQMAYVSDVPTALSSLTGSISKAQSFSTTVFSDQANTYTAGDKQTFASNATNPGIGHTGVSADPSTLSNGDSWYRTDLNRLMIRANGVSQQIAHVSDIPTPASTSPTNTNVTPVTVSGTTTETTLQTVTTQTGELNVVGRWVTVTARGTYTTGATPGTLTLKIKNGSTVLLSTSAVALNATLTNAALKFSCDIMTKTTGATGTSEVQCDTILNGTSVNGWAITAPVTSDLTGAVVLTITATFTQTTSGATSRIMGYERNN